MNEFSSLIIGTAYGVIVFMVVVGWMRAKRNRKQRGNQQRDLFGEQHRPYDHVDKHKDEVAMTTTA